MGNKNAMIILFVFAGAVALLMKERYDLVKEQSQLNSRESALQVFVGELEMTVSALGERVLVQDRLLDETTEKLGTLRALHRGQEAELTRLRHCDTGAGIRRERMRDGSKFTATPP